MKEIGRYQREHMSAGGSRARSCCGGTLTLTFCLGIEPYTFGFLGKILGWSETECKVMIAKVREEVRDKSLHMFIKFYFVCGRKPGGA